MYCNQHMLRSFISSEGKLVLCNEPFFEHFGHCTQHLIGKSIAQVFSSLEAQGLLVAVSKCQQHPDQSFTVEIKKCCKDGHRCFRWVISAEQQHGKLAGIHLVGYMVKPEPKEQPKTAAWQQHDLA